MVWTMEGKKNANIIPVMSSWKEWQLETRGSVLRRKKNSKSNMVFGILWSRAQSSDNWVSAVCKVLNPNNSKFSTP